ncbi:MAG: TIGR04076 family protein [Clostridia bacterium]|nr:TIGR04076 family protein [Clostridia bacterium]
MKKVKITAVRKTEYTDLMELYENPIEHTCDIKVGDSFISEGGKCPEGFCDSAWESVKPFVTVLANGGGNFYDGWMKNKYSAMISCNDGFRPVSFLLEVCE